MRVTLGAGMLNYSRLMKLARENPRARELHVSPPDFRVLAVKEPTTPARQVKPEGAGQDWAPPEVPVPTEMRFDAGDRHVLVRPDQALHAGEVEVR